jgi:soluble cytochrome b562
MEIINESIECQAVEISKLEQLKEHFELRLALINTNNVYKTEFEKNESAILKIETEINLNKLKKVIEQKIHDFTDTLRIFVQELDELEN